MDDKALMDQKALESFVENLIKEKNSPYVNDKNFAEVKDEMLKDLTDAINRKLISLLNDAQVDELNKLLDAKVSDEQLSQFFSKNIADLEKPVTEVLIDFRKGYLSVVYQPQNQTPNSLSIKPPTPPPPAPVPNIGDKKMN